MNNNIKNKIPTISKERLEQPIKNSSIVSSTKEEKMVQSFLKDKEAMQTFTIRMTVDLYKKLRRIAFEKEEKMNKIIVKLISKYVDKNQDYWC